MARKPNVQSDRDNWGDVLNEYLGVSLDTDGGLKSEAVSAVGDTLYPDKAATEAALAPLATLPSYGQELRRKGVQLAWGKAKEAHLNDRNDIDATGTDPMGAAISTYLPEYYAQNIKTVYVETGEYAIAPGAPVTIPAGMMVEAAAQFGQQQPEGNTRPANFFATGNDAVLIDMTGSYASATGLSLTLGKAAGQTGIVGIRAASYAQEVAHCIFRNAGPTSIGVKNGPAMMYWDFHHNIFTGGWDGLALDLIAAHDSPSAYFGVNEAWIHHNIMGPSRLQGIASLVHNTFEFSTTAARPAIHGYADAQGGFKLVIDDNYSEAVDHFLYLEPGGWTTVERVESHAKWPQTVGGYFVKLGGFQTSFISQHNKIHRFETGHDLGDYPTANANATMIVGPNTYNSVGTEMTEPVAPRTVSANPATVYSIHERHWAGRHVYRGALVTEQMDWYLSSDTGVLDLRRANAFRMVGAAGTLTGIVNGYPGHQFSVTNGTAGTVTIQHNASGFVLPGGANVTLAPGEAMSFVSDTATRAVAVRDPGVASMLGASGKGVVNHGAAAGTARPTGYASIEWIGSVEPTNMANGDTWVVVTP